MTFKSTCLNKDITYYCWASQACLCPSSDPTGALFQTAKKSWPKIQCEKFPDILMQAFGQICYEFFKYLLLKWSGDARHESKKVFLVLVPSRIVDNWEVLRQKRRLAITPIRIDALTDVFNVLPATLQPDVVVPRVGISFWFDALHHDLFWISRSHDNKSCSSSFKAD